LSIKKTILFSLFSRFTLKKSLNPICIRPPPPYFSTPNYFTSSVMIWLVYNIDLLFNFEKIITKVLRLIILNWDHGNFRMLIKVQFLTFFHFQMTTFIIMFVFVFLCYYSLQTFVRCVTLGAMYIVLIKLMFLP